MISSVSYDLSDKLQAEGGTEKRLERSGVQQNKKTDGAGMTSQLSYLSIDRRDDLSREEFIDQYLKPKRPVIMRSFAANWPALEKWSYDYLKQGCGDVEVPLYSEAFANSDNDYLDSTQSMPFGEYLDLIQAGPTPLRMFLFNVFKHMPQLREDFSYPDLGVTFLKNHPFLFVGGQDAYVDIHYDLDHSHVFLTQMTGTKRVILYGSENGRHLYQHPLTVSCNIDFRNPDLERYPKLKDIHGYECILEPGDTIFIPSRWWHFIEYSTAGISLTLRALPETWPARAAGLASIFKLKVIDQYLGKMIGEKKWYQMKEDWAHARARKA
ncbi:cupin [Thalassospira sp. MCCC 1A02803]|nr:cupin [Thalassospira sp. MCCC 1A02803]